MGFFSWITQDTNKSIANKYSERGTFKVVMTDNKGNKWVEPNYEGYGEFGGKDYYELLSEMNGGIKDRDNGIRLVYHTKQKLIYPNLNESEYAEWTNSEPDSCREQGYFYEG